MTFDFMPADADISQCVVIELLKFPNRLPDRAFVLKTLEGSGNQPLRLAHHRRVV
jgi:hypothetical protein